MNLEHWTTQLADARSRRVVFVSHCLLNDNTRYLGGVRARGPAAEIVTACLQNGIGIVQLPCPESCAWGGVPKRRMVRVLGSRGTWKHRIGLALLPLFTLYTRAVYWRLGRRVAAEIDDHARSGVAVLGVIGVDGSPSCGVNSTIPLLRGFEQLAALGHESTPADVRRAVDAAVVEGEGLFVTSLRRQLARRGLTVVFSAHDFEEETRPI